MRETVWRTDEPCPCCDNGLTMLDGAYGLRWECRLCGHNETLTDGQAAEWR